MNRKKLLALFTGTVLLLIVTFVLHNFIPLLENSFYNLSFSFKQERTPESVVIVGIDLKSIEEIGSFPWSRSKIAELLELVSSGSPRVIAPDFLFPRRADQKENDSLKAVFSRIDNLVLPFRAGNITNKHAANIAMIPQEIFRYRFLMQSNSDQFEKSLFYAPQELHGADPVFAEHAVRSGFLNVSTRRTTQILREVIHVIKAGEDYFPSFAIAAVSAYMELKSDEIRIDGQPKVVLGDLEIPITTYAGSTLLNYNGRKGTITTISAADIFSGTVPVSVFKNKLVFVGITDPSAGIADFFITPVGAQFPGVEIWATAAADILEKSWIKSPSGILKVANWLFLLLLFPGLALIVPSEKNKLAVITGFCIIGLSSVLWYGLFIFFNTEWNPGFHMYGWFFSLIWLAAQKADPTLRDAAPLELEPSDSDNIAAASPPSESDTLKEVPDSESARFVAEKLSAEERNEEIKPDEITKTMTQTTTDSGKCEYSLDIVNKVKQLAGGEIVKILGCGGMADVYLIWNPRMEVYRAVKVIRPGQPKNIMERFETEIRIFANLNFRNIVQCYSVGEWYSLPYVEMEYVPGMPMDEVLKKKKVLAPQEVMAIGINICRALNYAHNQMVTVYGKSYKGVIHRDLKPANVLLSRNALVKLTDFGIARPGSVSLHTGATGNIIGTFPYLAPEQLEGEEITFAADIYALGATLYEMLCGRRAFPQQDITTMMHAKTTHKVTLLQQFAPGPKELSLLIDKAMSVKPSQRFASAKEMARELEKILRASVDKNGDRAVLADLAEKYCN